MVVGGRSTPNLQRFIVAPNEIDRERPFIANAIKFTRQAYALDRFEEREFSAVEDLSLNDIRENEATFRNVRMWDHKPLLTTFAQLQEIRTYYDFQRVDNDRYRINGFPPGLALAAGACGSQPAEPELDQRAPGLHPRLRSLPRPVNEFTSEGLPVLFIKNIPPVSTTSIRITRPESTTANSRTTTAS